VTDASWRRIYNKLAADAELRVDAFGNDAHTVLVVTLPLGTSPDVISVTLWQAANLLATQPTKNERLS
jgi:hypothetical protein